MFGRSLSDLIKGIRSHQKNEKQFISQCLRELKQEVGSSKPETKVQAIRKLNYLHMLGYDMGWANFNIVEVMSFSKFAHKRVGYSAAAQSFGQDTDVITLTTNLFRKDMAAPSMFEQNIAVTALAMAVTPELARDLLADVVPLLSSSKESVRKRAVVLVYRCLLRFPDPLPTVFPRLVERLKDDNTSVVLSTVNILIELAQKNPKNYVRLAPQLFRILTSTQSDQLLLKVVKLFGILLPHEPRLARKLTDPLTNLIQNTPTKSVLYACISTAVVGMTSNVSMMKSCAAKLIEFIQDGDQNLKYLGLVGVSQIMRAQPRVLTEVRASVLECLVDDDVSIRLRALDIVVKMVTRKNLKDVVRKLLAHADEDSADATNVDVQGRAQTEFRKKVVMSVMEVCSRDNYKMVTDFEWMLETLSECALQHSEVAGEDIARLLLDVAVRVPAVRARAVSVAAPLAGSEDLLDIASSEPHVVSVLKAAAWIVGEYASEIADHQLVALSLLQPLVWTTPPVLQSMYVSAAFKVYVGALPNAPPKEQEEVRELLDTRLEKLVIHNDVDLQERACGIRELLRIYGEMEGAGASKGLRALSGAFADPLNPVAPRAQRKVPVPEGLELDKFIATREEDMLEEEPDDEDLAGAGEEADESDEEESMLTLSQTSESRGGSVSRDSGRHHHRGDSSSARQGRKKVATPAAHLNDPFYLPASTPISGSRRDLSMSPSPEAGAATQKSAAKDLDFSVDLLGLEDRIDKGSKKRRGKGSKRERKGKGKSKSRRTKLDTADDTTKEAGLSDDGAKEGGEEMYVMEPAEPQQAHAMLEDLEVPEGASDGSVSSDQHSDLGDALGKIDLTGANVNDSFLLDRDSTPLKPHIPPPPGEAGKGDAKKKRRHHRHRSSRKDRGGPDAKEGPAVEEAAVSAGHDEKNPRESEEPKKERHRHRKRESGRHKHRSSKHRKDGGDKSAKPVATNDLDDLI